MEVILSLPDCFPELGSDLVSALTSLDVDNFSHDVIKSLKDEEKRLGLITRQDPNGLDCVTHSVHLSIFYQVRI